METTEEIIKKREELKQKLDFAIKNNYDSSNEANELYLFDNKEWRSVEKE